MNEISIERTLLWKNAFGMRSDGNDNHRSRFTSCLLRFRDRVGQLLTQMPGDMKGYTVHDLSHLDALWEIGDLIAGSEFHLNPAEAFVFGGSVLLHDAGMTVSAYTNGQEELKNTEQWNDAVSVVMRKRDEDKNKSDPLTQEEMALSITDTLRILHAKKAEALALQSWEYPRGSGNQYLCEDSELRCHYGQLIGLIAHSHHWNIDQVIRDLPKKLGSFGEMPIDWTVDSLKVALLLRCADAAHIDHRRAPRLLFSLTKPTSVSLKHWNFQSKLSKPTIENSKIIYTSVSKFSVDEAESWQLCYDTIKMVDKELGEASDLLSEKKIGSFRAVSVLGAKSAKTLSEHIGVDGWKPLQTEIQVSDVPHLAKTLGGHDLYSEDVVPIRELIQNAADAIDARAAMDEDFSMSDGKITVRLSDHLDHENICIDIEDNGIGMSERVLTGALIDFGFSFWRSESARSEFPGLQSKFQNPRGRYGIGFFSVFMWAEKVTVASRRYREGVNDTRVLEFPNGLGKRPIIRMPRNKESSTKYNTKVTMTIKKEVWLRLSSVMSKENFLDNREKFRRLRDGVVMRMSQPPLKHFPETLASVCGALQIPVYYEHEGKSELVNLPNWRTASTDVFIAFLKKIFPDGPMPRHEKFWKAESKIVQNSQIIGRAFLEPNFGDYEHRRVGMIAYENGICVGRYYGNGACGFIETKARNAARDRFNYYNLSSNAEWIDDQKRYLSKISENIGEVIACQESLLRFSAFMEDDPLFLINRKIVSFNQLIEIVRISKTIKLFLREMQGSEDSKMFGTSSIDSPNPFIGKIIDEHKLFFLCSFPGQLSENDDMASLRKTSQIPLRLLAASIINAIGANCVMNKNIINRNDYSKEKAMIIELKEL